jgi:hypothetical protein
MTDHLATRRTPRAETPLFGASAASDEFARSVVADAGAIGASPVSGLLRVRSALGA